MSKVWYGMQILEVHIKKTEYVSALIKADCLSKSASNEKGIQTGSTFLDIQDEQHLEESRTQLDNFV